MMCVIGWLLEVGTKVADNRPPWLYPERLLCSRMPECLSSAAADKRRTRSVSPGQGPRRDVFLTDGN
jgi:hypothetical protein